MSDKKEEEHCKEFLEKSETSLIFQFHHIHKAMFRLANKRVTDSGVPVKMEQLPVLMTLYWMKNQSQQEVADRVNRDKSSVMRTVSLLEKMGLLVNKKDEEDARRKVLTLTKTGKFMVGRIIELLEEVEDEIYSALANDSKEGMLNWMKTAALKLDELTNS